MLKDLSVGEIINTLDKTDITILMGKGVSLEKNKMNIILVTHEFSRSGAPTVLLEMAKLMISKGISVWALCEKEGKLLDQFVEEGANVIIYNNYINDTRWLRRARNCFDLWCVNTIVLGKVFSYLNKINANVVWWVHEGEYWFEASRNLLQSIELGSNSKIFAAGPYVQQMFKKYMNKEVPILNFMVKDDGICIKQRGFEQKVRFLQAGTIDGIKRQGLFAEAIELLSDEVREASEFIFCGDRERANIFELAKIDRVTEKYDNAKLIPQVDRETLYKMYEEIDAVVVASNIETTSAIMVEAMMKGKFGICSNTCGITHYMEDGKNGYIFQMGSARDLADKITYVVNNINALQQVGIEGRKVYEKFYSEEVFSQQINEIVAWAEENENLLDNVPLTSIIVVSFNNAQKLVYTLQSIYNQTWKNFEIIVIDDASTDNTIEVIEAAFGINENLKYIFNEEHLGKGECFNIGLDCCEGAYIAFAEAGDEWVSDKLQNQLETLITNKEYEGVYTYAQVIGNDGKNEICPRISKGSKQLPINIQHLIVNDLDKVCIGTVLLNRSVFERIGFFRNDLDDNAPYEFLFREISKLNMFGISELTVLTKNQPVKEESLEDFICANCLILINQIEDIVTSGHMEKFYSWILIRMEKLGVKDYFVEILRDNADGILKIYGEQKRINVNMKECSGCGACARSCPVSAIRMELDDEGFVYPVINEEKCINCNKCVNVCPVNYDKPMQDKNQEIYAVKIADECKRMESQSGGAFCALAEAMLNANGVVYGAGFDADLSVVYLRVNKKEDLYRLKGSKYVQAKVGNVFSLVLEDLQAGRLVLFSGTACHVDGLKHLVGDLGHNLFTCDLVCHGVPSPMIYRDYLSYIGRKNGNVVKEFNFRNKATKGWRVPEETWRDVEGNEYAAKDYTQLFYSRLGFRESCYSCRYASMHRISDITIGDFWGIEKVYPEMDDGKGVSLMLINSQKGEQLFEKIKPQIEYRGATATQCKQHNLLAPSNRPDERDAFWKDYNSKDFRYILRAYANEHYAIAANKIVLSNWEKWLEEGKRISRYLLNNHIARVAVCGDANNNKLIISDLKRDFIQITAEIDVYERTALILSGEKVSMDLVKFVESALDDTDAVIITDETHCVDIIDKLYEAGVPLSKILPFSFIVTQEV